MKVFLRKTILFLLLIAFGYLGQVCIMPYVRIFGVTPGKA